MQARGGSSDFIHSGALPPIDEERSPTRRYYFGGQAATPTALEMVKKNDVSVSGLSFAPNSSMQDSNDGISFEWESRSPSHGRTERNDRTEVFKDDETNYSNAGSRSILSVLSGFSSVLLRKNLD